MSPAYVCDKGGMLVAIQTNKILSSNSETIITLKNREDKVLDMIPHQAEEHSIGYDTINIVLPTQHLAPSLISGSVGCFHYVRSNEEESIEKSDVH